MLNLINMKGHNMKTRFFLLACMVIALTSCSTLYYNTMERLGIEKREILVDRVKDARDTQNETKEQFLTAMEKFRSVVDFNGGDLEDKYNELKDTLDRTEDGADAVRDRIRAVEDVSEALFDEWRGEIDQYNSDVLRRASREKYNITKDKYNDLISAMKKAESRLEPALEPLRDQVLFLKHNLNARAIAGLSNELIKVETNVDNLVREMNEAIAEADRFISELETE